MTTKSLSILLGLATLVGACGDDGSTGSGGGGSGGGATVQAQGCDDAKLLANPADTSLDGPWPVGAVTVDVAGLKTEIWYPATPGSEASASPKVYDLREWLPAAEAAKISDAKTPSQTCDCFPDLPLDEAHGPYPVVVFVHGTAGFRTQSLELVQHWASRGFVVVAADHPGLYLGDLITSLPICDGDAPAQDLEGDLAKLVAAIQAPSGDLAFLADHIDAAHLGMVGHSAGGGAVATQAGVAEVVIPLAAGGVDAGSAVKSVLVMGGLEDQVVDYSSQQSGYTDTVAPKKRLVGLSPAGHLTFSSLCAITNADGEDIVTVGGDSMVCGLSLAGALFDCDPSYLPAEEGWKIVNDATSAVLEETLQCTSARAEVLTSLQSRYEAVSEYQEE